MQRAVFFAAVTVIAAASGCVSSIEERSTARGALGLSIGSRDGSDALAEQPPPPAVDPHPALLCVMEVPGTGIHMSDVDGGLAVVFDTVARGSVADLRRAVRQLGEDLASGRHDDHSGHHSPRALALARRLHAASGALPSMVATVDDVRGGARLVVRAAETSERDRVRDRMRAEIEMMQRGVCPLLAQ